jgi:hypothetical protein
MHELPADPAAVGLAGAVPGDPVADMIEAPQPLNVQVDEITGVIALVAAHGFRRLQILQTRQARAPQDPADRGRRHAGLVRDMRPGQALAAQCDYPLANRLGCGLVQLRRPRCAILQSCVALSFEASIPL